MDKIVLKQISSLDKVMLKSDGNFTETAGISAFKNERVAYQVAFTKTHGHPQHMLTVRCGFRFTVDSPIKDLVDIRMVGNVPSTMPAYTSDDGYDDNYISVEPGLFPDPLYKPTSNRSYATINLWSSLFVMVDLKGVAAGEYPITINFEIDDPQWNDECLVEFENGKKTTSLTFTVKVLDASLPELDIMTAQWFHADCLYTYYDVPCFSEKHWELIDKYIKMAADYGINTVLTPMFTPPLDTFVNCERPTIQLVDIALKDGKYSFGFEKFERWVKLCLDNGIKFFEMAHLFTQWGAEKTPKIFVEENGVLSRKFGWDVAADSDEYFAFLDAFLPALIAEINKLGIKDNTFFHISDEPSENHLEHYLKLNEYVRGYLGDFLVTDALSNYDFYARGVVDAPIVSINHIEPFVENKVERLFGYYCCGQTLEVSNRLFAMPSARNRIMGLQMFKFKLAGFLQWGYNFYYSKGSEFLLDPFRNTDALSAFVSGDSFSVYPDKNGPLESLRLVVFAEALQDLRALKLLASLIGHDEVVKIMEELAGGEITFKKYPKDNEFILNLREKVNTLIAERLEK